MPVLEQVIEKYPDDVKLVFKNYPIRRIHKFAWPAAIAALSAERQGKFWGYHDLLYKDYKNLSEQKFQEIARALNLDMEKFERDRKDPRINATISRELSEGRKAGVRGTPTVFINGRLLKNRRFEGFRALIEAELKKAKKGPVH